MPEHVLLTGATDGIGLQLARLWGGRGRRPLLVGRRPLEALDPLRHPAELFRPDRYVRADLAREDAAERVVAFLDRHGVRFLQRLVLNAGVGWAGAVEDQPQASIRELLEVNLWSTIALCHALLPRVRAVRGRIVLVSSVVSALPAPRFAVYAASKAALEGFARSLRAESAGAFEVQVLRPGATRTGIHRKSGATAQGVDPAGFPEAEQVARAIDEALGGPPRWRTLGLANRAARFAGRNLPRLVDAAGARAAARTEEPR